MLKVTAAGLTALLTLASPLAHAQNRATGAGERLSAGEIGALTDARINVLKAALQLTPEQQKYWQPIEEAIRGRAKDRQARLAGAVRTVGEARSNPVEALRDRNPIDFMHQRAEALSERAADLMKLADAWQPLYQTLSTEQKRRMGELAVLVIREAKDGVEQRRLDSE